MNKKALKDLLDTKVLQFNSPDFISEDPIAIPHSFRKKEDIEISAFLVSVFAWGQRKTIVNNGFKLMELMDNAPHDFILHHDIAELKRFKKFVHRTFNGDDAQFFICRLQEIYQKEKGLESFFASCYKGNMQAAIAEFKKQFFAANHSLRTEKHLPDPTNGSSAKRFNMYLRWMVRQDNAGVDFGVWRKIKMQDLYCPLDVHTGNVARKLGILKRSNNDWQSLEELMKVLRSFDKNDPAKYDFALFGLGVSGEI